MANRFEDKVASVSKALTIMEVLSKEPEGMGLIEISSQVGMNKTTVYRLLTSLMEKEFVEQNEKSGKYSLGMKILSIASALYQKLDIRAIVRKHVQELAEGFEGTILVTREMNGEYMVADCICMGDRPPVYIGEGEFLTSGQAVQKAFLANVALWQPGWNKISAPEQENPFLKQQLKQTVIQGYAEAMEDLGGFPAVAAPVFNFSRNVAYVVSLHSAILKKRKVQSEWILVLLELAGRISSDLGFVNYI